MTEQQKQAALDSFEKRAQLAERNGLRSTAKSWRDLAESVRRRPAAEIIYASGIFDRPDEPMGAVA